MLRYAARGVVAPARLGGLAAMAGLRAMAIQGSGKDIRVGKHNPLKEIEKAASELPHVVENVIKQATGEAGSIFERLKKRLEPTPTAVGPAPGTVKKVAVIGGGVSGVVCANQLFSDPQKRYNVTLFELEDRLGGNVRTVFAKDPQGNTIPVDTGVVFTEENFYPNVFKYLLSEEFKTETEMVKLGMTGVFADGKGGEEMWSNVIYGMPLRDKFNKEADRLMLSLATLPNVSNALAMFGTTAQKFLEENKYSPEFIQKAVIPMLLTFAITRNGLLSVPLAILHLYFGGGALNFNQGSYGRRAVKGMHTYIDKFAAKLKSVTKTSTPVEAIRRRPDGKVDVSYTSQGKTTTETFDDVVITVLKDTALKMLGPSALVEERLAFNMINYEDMAVSVHNDPNVISPILRNPDGTWNYQFFNYRYLGNDFGDYVRGATTYVPRWQLDKKPTEVLLPLLTYSNAEEFPGVITPRPELIVDKKIFRHVRQSIPQSLAGLATHKFQGRGGVWYAGNDILINFHEGALCSGLIIAKALGVPYPFEKDLKQAWIFNMFEAYMLRGQPPMELLYLNPH